jgi:pSer/pThr/pTyr-binding forkhead associated (FHA) protein
LCDWLAHGPSDKLQRMSDLTLEVVEGPGAGRQIRLSGPVEVGRDAHAGLVLRDDLASRHHVRISPADGGAVVEDLGSLNGTFVNGNEIHSPTRLSPGDQLLIGVTVLELRSPAQVAERPSAVQPIPPALAVAARRPDYIPKDLLREQPSPLDRLLDTRTKRKAKHAPIAIFVLVVFVVLIFLAQYWRR